MIASQPVLQVWSFHEAKVKYGNKVSLVEVTILSSIKEGMISSLELSIRNLCLIHTVYAV